MKHEVWNNAPGQWSVSGTPWGKVFRTEVEAQAHADFLNAQIGKPTPGQRPLSNKERFQADREREAEIMMDKRAWALGDR